MISPAPTCLLRVTGDEVMTIAAPTLYIEDDKWKKIRQCTRARARTHTHTHTHKCIHQAWSRV